MLTIFLISGITLTAAGVALALTGLLLRFLAQSFWARLNSLRHRSAVGWSSFNDLEPSVPGTRYPADWMARRSAVITRAHGRCEDCKLDLRKQRKEVHHMRRTRADGVGDHALGNLKCLCVQCHAKQPGHAWILTKR